MQRSISFAAFASISYLLNGQHQNFNKFINEYIKEINSVRKYGIEKLFTLKKIEVFQIISFFAVLSSTDDAPNEINSIQVCYRKNSMHAFIQ